VNVAVVVETILGHVEDVQVFLDDEEAEDFADELQEAACKEGREVETEITVHYLEV